MNKLEEVLNEYQNNPIFQKEFKEDPFKALEDAGFVLSQEDLQKIGTLLHAGELLSGRISK